MKRDSDCSNMVNNAATQRNAGKPWAALLNQMQRSAKSHDDKICKRPDSCGRKGKVGLPGSGGTGITSKWGVFQKSTDDIARWNHRKSRGKLKGQLRDNHTKLKGTPLQKSQTSITKYFKAIGPEVLSPDEEC